MASVAIANITIPQHDDFIIYFQVVDGDGVFVDVTVATEIVYEVADSITGTEQFKKTLSASEIGFQNSNTVYVELTSTETGLTPGNYYHELRLTNATGDNSTVLKGTYTIEDTRIGDP